MEEKQSARLIAADREKEIAASHQKILSSAAPKLWEKIKLGVREIIESNELRGLNLVGKPVSENSIMVSIFHVPTITPTQVVYLNFVPGKYKFEVIDSNGSTLSEVRLGVSDGRVVLSDMEKPIPDDEGEGLKDIACQRLLQPVLLPYAGGL